MNKTGGEKTFTWDDPAILLGIFALGYFACWGAWYFAHSEIAMLYTHIRYAELFLFNALGSSGDIPGLRSIHHWVQETCRPDGLLSFCQRDFSDMQWRDISSSSVVVNGVCLFVMVLFCVRLFLRANARHPKLNFSKTHSIQSFVKENQLLYPHLKVFSALDLIAQPLDHPLFGMSKTSRQFAFQQRLVSGWKEEMDGSWAPTLDREKAFQVFRLQLGRLWIHSSELSVGETLLAAIAMPRVAATDSSLDEAAFKAAIKDSEDLLRWCWGQFNPTAVAKQNKEADDTDALAWLLQPAFDLTYPRRIIARYIGHPAVQRLIHQHAYNRTILFALFTQARRLGVLQPAEMRWMRFFDRSLWYLLQTIGRQAGFAEAAAVLSHYLYECKAGKALIEPQLDKAINGLELAMTAFKYSDTDKQGYEKEKKG